MERIQLEDIKGHVYITPMCGVSLVVYHLLQERGVEILGFCDGNESKQGKSYHGCPVLSRKKAAEGNPGALFIVASIRFQDGIRAELEGLGVSEIILAQQFLSYENSFDSTALHSIDENQAVGLANFFDKKSVQYLVLSYYLPDTAFEPGMQGLGFIRLPVLSIDLQMEILDYYYSYWDFIIDLMIEFPNFEKALTFVDRVTKGKYVISTLEIFIIGAVKPDAYFFGLQKYNIPVYRYGDSQPINKSSICFPYGENISRICIRFDSDIYTEYEKECKCIFIHIPKTSGTSLTNYISLGHSRIQRHRRIVDFKTADECLFNQCFKFAIVRDPWDLLVSQYFYNNKLYSDDYKLTSLPKDLQLKIKKTRYPWDKTFREFILGLKDPKISSGYHQHYWVCDDDGNLLTDYIGRYENLEESYHYIASKVGVDPGRPIPKLNTTKHRRYQDYYDDETREIVREVFKKDIELFGYDFE